MWGGGEGLLTAPMLEGWWPKLFHG